MADIVSQTDPVSSDTNEQASHANSLQVVNPPEATSAALIPVRPEVIVPEMNGHAAHYPGPRGVSVAPMNATSVLRAFRARWWQALATGICLAILAGSIAYFANPSKYHVSRLIRVLSSQPTVLDRQQVQETDKSPFQKAQLAVVTSQSVLSAAAKSENCRAIANSGRYGDSLTSWLERNIKVGYLEDTDIMQVSLSGDNAQETATLLNQVVESYVREFNKSEEDAQKSLVDALGKSADRLQISLVAEKTKLFNLVDTLKTGDTKVANTKQMAALDEYTSQRKEIALMNAQLRELRVKEATCKALLATEAIDVPPFVVEQQVEMDRVVLRQVEELRKKEEILHRNVKSSVNGDSGNARLEDDVKSSRAELERLRVEARERVTAVLRKKTKVEASATLKQIEEEISIRKNQLKEMQDLEVALGKKVEEYGRSSYELESKRMDVDQAEKTLIKVRDQKEQLRVEHEASRKRVTAYPPVEAPTTMNTRSQTTLAGLASFGGLAFGILGISLLEARTRRIHSEHEVEEVSGELGMKVVGTLPVRPGRWSTKAQQVWSGYSRRLPALAEGTISTAVAHEGYWNRLLEESVAYIRTIVLSGRRPAIKCLMVTSARPREGKTTLACALAKSIARTGRKTLLVDADLRRPKIAPQFGIANSPGLSEALRCDVDLPTVIASTSTPNLWLLPAGRCSPEVIEELGKERIESYFAMLRAEYDFIVMDSSPVLPVSDALALGRRIADAVVCCVRPGVSRTPSVQTAHRMLRALDIPVLGAVINGSVRHQGDGDFHDYYYYQRGDATPASPQ